MVCFLSGILGAFGDVGKGLLGSSIGSLFGKGGQSAGEGVSGPTSEAASKAGIFGSHPPGEDNFFEGLGAQTGSALQAIPGQILSGKVHSSMSKKHMDKLYPGTNPWERLGAGGAGASQASAAMSQQQTAIKMKREELRNQKQIAELQARKDRDVAAMQTQATVNAAHIGQQAALEGTAIQRQMAPAQIFQARHMGEQARSQASLNDVRRDIEKAFAPLRETLLALDIPLKRKDAQLKDKDIEIKGHQASQEF